MSTAFFIRATITPDHSGPLVEILAWLLLITTFLAVVARGVTKYIVLHKLGWDDAAVFSALALQIGQVATVSVAVSAGLGQHYDTLATSQIEVFQKALYASELLFVLSLAFSKASVLMFIHYLTPRTSHRNVALAITGIIVLWSVVSFIATTLQCNIPLVWQVTDPSCFRQYTFWTFYNTFNIVSELAIMTLAVAIMWKVQVKKDRKLTIIGCFATRIIIIISIICQLIYATVLAEPRADPTFAWWPVEICVQFVQSLSIITACIPCIKALYINLESGMIRVDDIRRRQVPTSTFKEQESYYKYSAGVVANQGRTSGQSQAEPILLVITPPASIRSHTRDDYDKENIRSCS